uniref:EGF-like domain-containing protein n=1 Tax=Haemonchus placei TaxID=6290 RepID=A0A0N4WV75_HAEPC
LANGTATDIETPFNKKIRKSCDECDFHGTTFCENITVGFVCHCKEGWKTSANVAPLASALALSTHQIIVKFVKAILLIYLPHNEQDPQTYYQDSRSFALTIAGFGVLLFRQPTLFHLSYLDCKWVFYVITASYLLGLGFFAAEALNALELITLQQPNSWITRFFNHETRDAELAVRTVVPIIVVASGLLTILAATYTKATSSWSCLGVFSAETIDLWSPIFLFAMCLALIATAFSYRGLFIRKHLPHYQMKVEIYLNSIPNGEKNTIEKRNLIFTAVGPWLMLLSYVTLAVSTAWVTASFANTLAIVFAALYGACNLIQSIFTTPEAIYKEDLGRCDALYKDYSSAIDKCLRLVIAIDV